MAHEHDVLRVARPRGRNAQQTGPEDATTRATSAQHTGLKALARKVLERNNPRNNATLEGGKTTQHRGNPEAVRVAEKPQGGEASPEATAALESFIDLVRITAACDHRRLLHRADIERELDADSVADLMRASREELQAWAAAIAARLAAPDPSWLPVIEKLRGGA